MHFLWFQTEQLSSLQADAGALPLTPTCSASPLPAPISQLSVRFQTRMRLSMPPTAGRPDLGGAVSLL